MAKTVDEVVDAIVRAPLDETITGCSHVDLIQRSGSLRHRGEVRVKAIYERLAGDPDLVEAWQLWVDDNRGVPAWYFTTLDSGEFEVGHIDVRHGKTTQRLVFDDRSRSCAEYILREIDDLAEIEAMWRRPCDPSPTS